MKTKIALVVAVCVWAAPAFHLTGRARQVTTRSVIDGIYTEEQAWRGESIYKERCETCHGVELKGGDMGPPLTADDLVAGWGAQPLADLFLKIKATMPPKQPVPLVAQQAADVLAYILQRDKFPVGTTELPADATLLNDVRLEAPKP